MNIMKIIKGGIDPFVNDLITYMTSPGAYFYGRIGGGETTLSKQWTELVQSNPPDLKEAFIANAHIQVSMGIMKKYGGFYDIHNTVESDMRFCEYYSSLYKSYDSATLAGPDTASYYLYDKMAPPYNNPQEKAKFDVFLEKCFSSTINLYPYCMIENPLSFLKAFKTFALNKKILIISPFSRSIQKQYPLLSTIFPGYTFPSFTLLTYNPPITYNDNGVPYISFPHSTWFETTNAMCEDIQKLDFDIALLGCSTYTLPLGAFIKNMGKKAIYMGAILQACFGVIGTRWVKDSFFLANPSGFIYPLETTEQINNAKKHHYAKEGFSGYF